MAEDRDTPFFVVGSDRSGTTMFRLMLNKHSRLAVPRESRFLADLLDEFGPTATLDHDDIRRAGELVREDPRWPYWNVEPERLERALASLPGPPTPLAAVVDAVNRLGADGKPRWGDKNPPYVFEISRIAQLFPAAPFIHVIRDGRDVALSLRRSQWRGRVTADTASYWRDCILAGRQQGGALGPDRYLEIRYEDLVLDTRRTLAEACAFLGEEFEDGMLSFYESAPQDIAAWEAPYHTKTARAPEASDVEVWRREMRPSQIALFEASAGDAMDLVGQERHFQGPRRIALPLAHLAFRAVVASWYVRRRLGMLGPAPDPATTPDAPATEAPATTPDV